MTTEKLLAELGSRNIRLRRKQDELVLIGNKEALEPSLISQVRAHKASLLELIGNDPSAVLNPGVRITPDMVTLLEMTQEEIDAVVGQVPGGAANVQDIYPLAPIQEGILFHHLVESKSDPYLMGVIIRFKTREQMDKYLGAVQWVVNRHDILRTGIFWEGLRKPVQVVWRKAQVPVEEVDLGEDGDAADKLYERFNPRRIRVDVRQAPIMRSIVAEDKKDGSWLMMRLVHHLIGDHYSMDLMLEEINACLMGKQEELPPPAPFREMLVEMRMGVGREEHERFFREMLGEVKEPTAPFGLLQVLGDGTGVEEATLELERALTIRIRERARKLRVSAAILFHLAWACVVARTSRREEAVFGTVLFGQLRRGTSEKRVMGVFINALPVRITVADEGVEAAVGKTQAVLAEITRHEHASLVLAQKCSGVPAPQPLFTSLLNYRHIRRIGGGAEGTRAWQGISYLRGEERSNYPLLVSINDLGEYASITAQTDTSVDPARVCRFMCKAMESLVEALETEPSRRVGTIEVMPETEREQVLQRWNATQWEYQRERCVPELFEEQAQRTPEAVAVVHEDQQLTYGQLNRRANKLAHYLQGLGVKADSRVAICMERNLGMIEAVLGVLKAGAAYVPLDPTYPAERLRWMLDDSKPVALLTQASALGLFDKFRKKIPILDVSAAMPRWSDQPETNLGSSRVGLAPANLAYVIYTSGSTGTPKGVMGTHAGMLNRLQWMWTHFPFSNDEVGCAKTSLGFLDSFWEIFGNLLQGRRIVLIATQVVKDTEQFIQQLESAGVTRIVLVPTLLRVILELGPSVVPRLRNLKFWVTSGEKLPSDLVRSFHQMLPHARLLNLYGSSEVSADATWHEISQMAIQTVLIGRPIANTRVYILDENQEPMPVGVVGELHIGGVGVARGYLNRPELTAERFLPDPFVSHEEERMYRTGDLGKWHLNGEIECVGRNDFQVKVRGYRIELGEIEAALQEFTGVEEAAVILREDVAGAKRLVAYYTIMETEGQRSNEGAALAPNPESLRAHVAAALPDYMVPAAYVRMERLPLTVSGKLDRKALPKPEGDAYAVREYEAPQGLVETMLAQIWLELLGIERVGRRDNFFNLGGHSLLALQVIARIQRELGREAALKDLFACPQLESFAALLELPRDHSAERPLPIRDQGAQPPIFFPHGADDQAGYAWALAPHIDPDMPIYELPAQQQKNYGARLRTIEGQAQRMVRMIRAVQPAGPYRIIGYCFGSFLAYEVARQLTGADETVFLALLDFRLVSGQTDRLSLVRPEAVNQDVKVKFLKTIHEHVVASGMPESAQKAVEELRQSSKTLEELIYYCKDMGWLPASWVLFTPARLQRLLTHMIDMERAPYLFPQLPVDIHMFVAQEEKSAADLPDDFAAVVPGARLKYFSVSGNHDTMIQNPNTKQLGLLLSQVMKEEAITRTSASAVSSLACLAGQPSLTHHQQAPLFCVPATLMRVNCFADLVSSFKRSQRVYGFQARGWHENAIPHTTIESEARFYLKELETVCPSGPVHLLGHLRGGWIAFEMALRLHAAGRNVLSLTLLESDPPDENSWQLREYTLTEVVESLLEFLQLRAGCPMIPLSNLEKERAVKQRQILLELLTEHQVLPPGAANEDLYRVLRMVGTDLRTRYMPHRALTATISLIRASEDKRREGNPDQRGKINIGWERWGGNLTEDHVPGNSLTMLQPPDVKILAEIIEEKLNRTTRSDLFQNAVSA